MNQPKPKRGQAFLNVDTGETIYLERIKSPLTYLMCDDSTLAITANFFEVQAHALKQVNKISGARIQSRPLSTSQHNEKKQLNEFFEQESIKIPFNCQGCNKPLYAKNKFGKRCVTAHILPKAYFKSVSTNSDNIFYLGAAILGVCSCHDNWDNKGAEDRVKMPCYKLAVERFEKFKHLLTDSELIKAYKYLNIKVDVYSPYRNVIL